MTNQSLSVVRLNYVDMARGFAILMVVTAHIVQYNLIDGIHNPTFMFIMSFHMPLFFAISGYIGQIVNKPICDLGGGFYYLKKKALALLLPLLIWSLVIQKLFFTSVWSFPTFMEIIQTLTHPGLWFLLALFRISIVYLLFQWLGVKFNKGNKIWKDILFLIPVLLLSGGFKTQSIQVDNVYLYTLFFYEGVMVAKHEILKKFFFCEWTFILAFIAFCILACHWGIISGSIDINDLLKLFIATSAFILVMNVCEKYENNNICKHLCLFGRYSMEIYVAHWTFLWLDRTLLLEATGLNRFWIFIIATIIAYPIIFSCIAFSKVVERSPKLRLIVFGRRK